MTSSVFTTNAAMPDHAGDCCSCPNLTLATGGAVFDAAASFVWRCLSGASVTPFPHPARRTGQAALRHPALGVG
jgi:hypothetical protein